MSEQTSQIVSEIENRVRAAAQVDPEVEAGRAERRKQDEENFLKAKVRDLWVASSAPKRHKECKPSFDGEFGRVAKSLEEKIGTGFLIALVGNRGSGKTQLAVETMKRSAWKLKPCRFVTAVEFFIEVKSTFGRDSERSERDILEEFQKPSLLVIDEVGKRGGSDWENNLLFELINRRYNDCNDTILIDNRTKSEFIETIGPSLASRMNECGGIVECNWESFRK